MDKQDDVHRQQLFGIANNIVLIFVLGYVSLENLVVDIRFLIVPLEQ